LKLIKKTAVLIMSMAFSGAAAAASGGLYDPGSFDLRGIPEIGTAGETALSVGKEIRFGKFFSRQARRMLPVTDDPVIDEYLASVGQKLIAASDGVRFPFHFFLVTDPELNAAAFLGGSVKVNSGLFHYAENESELAGVLAHEVSHITRRHLAQFIEASSRSNRLTLAGIAGAIALSMLNPALGAAALTTSIGAGIQAQITYTREHEMDADSEGIKTLYKAGFDPEGMVTFFMKLSGMTGGISIPQGLLTHPVPEYRVAAARSMAAMMPKRPAYFNSPDFYFAKARIAVRYERLDTEMLLAAYQKTLEKRPSDPEALYGRVMALLQLGRYHAADEALDILVRRTGRKDNLFVIDAETDISIGLRTGKAMLPRLEQLAVSRPDSLTVILNLANLYISSGQAKKAVSILDSYERRHDDSPLVYDMLARAWSASGNMGKSKIAKARYYALNDNFDESNSLLSSALTYTRGRLDRAYIEGLIIKNHELEREDQELSKSMK
jgi:predicted Zn-dependent protease